MAIRTAGAREIKGRKSSKTLVWRALRKRLISHYTKNYGTVPTCLQQDRIQYKITETSALAEFKAWAYRGNKTSVVGREADIR